jgi:UDP-N-acetylmuramate--alanine ligase
MENIKKAFRQFLENTDEKTGTCVLCADNENLREISRNLPRPVIFYGTAEDAEYRAVNIAPEGTGVAFDVVRENKVLVRVRLNIPGRHNVLNALGSVVTGILCGISPEKAAEALSLFHGAKRRFETKGRAAGVWVVDDYAHHPTEIGATLQAARQTNPKRLICAFQPHRYSRTQLLQKEFGGAFKDADLLILTDIYSAGEPPIAGVSGETILAAVEGTTGQKVTYIRARTDIAPHLASIVREGDLVMTMGAGDICRTGEELLALLAAREG